MIIINNNNENVKRDNDKSQNKDLNGFDLLINNEKKLDYFQLVKETEATRKKQSLQNQYSYFFKLIPDIHLSAVWYQINKVFNGDIQQYIDSVPLFLKFFTKEMKHSANNTLIVTKEENRKKSKVAKDNILYSAQLLNLVGGKTGARYITQEMTNLFIEKKKNEDDYVENFRLMASNGRIMRLMSNRQKRKIQRAKILNTSATLASIANERDWGFMLTTFTPPPLFHSNPTESDSGKYQGAKPSKGFDFLKSIWAMVRTDLKDNELKMGDDLFGATTCEAMKSSTLHLHTLIYTNRENFDLIQKIIEKVEAKVKYQLGIEKFHIDIKREDKNYKGKNGKPASGATYIFKYITKTINDIETADENTLKNMAVRWFYSARAFNFFGVKQARTKFDFLIANYKKYKPCLSDAIIKMFDTYDYKSFITEYEGYFKTVRGEKKEIKFVEFDLSANKWTSKFSIKSYTDDKLIIEKRIYTVLETNNQIREIEEEFKQANIKQLDKDDIQNINIFKAHSACIELENQFQAELDDYIEDSNSRCFRITDNSLITYLRTWVEFNLSYISKMDFHNKSKLFKEMPVGNKDLENILEIPPDELFRLALEEQET